MNHPPGEWGGRTARALRRRGPADVVLFGVTLAELAILIRLTPQLTAADWIYVCSNLLVLLIALSRRPAQVQDRSFLSSAAVLVSYSYSYAQVALLHWLPGHEAGPAARTAGLIVVLVGASMSLAGLLSLGRSFGVRPAWRGLATGGMYRLVRHPLYLAYVVQDTGYNLQEWNAGTLALVAAGWASLVYRILAEERLLGQTRDWPSYAARVRYRLLPGIW